ncbi:hypothetical protein NMY22_g6526 [Coprinellus aureogranulatus]|nr:hypothetical protein NMY22_g6526 [Coprinellus aureogranulatus]
MSHQRDILRLTEDSVHISFRGKCPLAAALLSCLPVYDTAVFVTVGLEAIVKCQKQLKRFFKRQKVWHLSVEFPVHSPHSIGLEAAAPSFPSTDPPIATPYLPIVPPSTTEGQFAGVWNLYRTVRSVRSITLSAEWTHLPHFHRLWAAVADAKQLATLTVSNITSQDQCNQLLSPLRSHSLKDLYILTKMNTALNLSSDFLQRHRGLKRMSLMAVPDPFDSTASSVPMTLPATPEIRLTSNFPSLTAVDASTISRLTMVPPCRYRLPSSMAYCNSLELFLRGVWSLDAISFHELDLSLEFPWRITEHLTSTVAGCQCLQLIQGFTITGVKKLRIVSDDFSSSAMAYFAQFQDIFVDMEELHYNVTSAVFRQSGGCSVSLATPPRAPNLRTFSVLDGTWTYDGIWTYDRQLWAPKEPTSRA